MNKINLTYNDLFSLINESIINVINEGRNAEKARQKTLEVIRMFFNNASWLDNEFNDAAANPNHLSVIDYIENKLREWLFHANIPDSIIRLEPIIMNIALSLGFEQQNQDIVKLNRLGMIVNYIIANFKKEGFPIQLNHLQLNNTTYDILNNIFGKYIDSAIQQDREAANSYGDDAQMNPQYTVIEIPDYETAKQYGDYSCSDSKLCYTQSLDTWAQYKNKFNRVYLILNKDWKNIPEKHEENTPYDKYGLSMIFIFIDPEGNIAYSNTRWNHKTAGNGPSNVDQSFSKADISKLLGVNFDDLFKPYSSDELQKWGYISFFDIPNLLSQGKSPEEIFEWVGKLNNGFLMVKLNGKFNFVNTEGKLVSPNQWFDEVNAFTDGFALVRLDDKYNFIDIEGNYLFPNQYFDMAGRFKNGFAVVGLDYKYNLIDTSGKIISPNQWFDYAECFYNENAMVELNDKFNFINKEGKLVSPNQWFDWLYDFEEGFARVKLNKKYNFINAEGKLVSPNQWFDKTYDFEDGFALVNFNDKWYYIDTEGKLYDEDKNPINTLNENKKNKNTMKMKISEDKLINIIKNIISESLKPEVAMNDVNSQWNRIYSNKIGKWNFKNGNNELLSPDKWFDYADKFYEGLAIIKLNGKWNFIKEDGKVLSPNQWFDKVWDFEKNNGELAQVLIDGKYFDIDKNGNLQQIYNSKKELNENSDEHENDFFAFVDVIEHCGWNFSQSYDTNDGEVFVMHPNNTKSFSFEDLVKEIKRNVVSPEKIIIGKRTNKNAPEQVYNLIKIKY